MAMSGKLRKDFLTCSICMDVYQQPVTLLCQHSFCKSCLQKYLPTRVEAVTNKTIPCPTCRQETPVPHPDRPLEEWTGQLKPGLLLTGLMDSVVEETKHCTWCEKEGKTTLASNWCADCESCMCNECLKLHYKVPVFSNHDVSKLTENLQKRLKQPYRCRKHKEKIQLFCRDCKTTLCTVCCSIAHRKCEDVVTIQDMLPEVKGQLMKRHEKLDSIAEGYTAKIAKHEDEVDKFRMKSATVKNDINKTIQAAVDHLREKENELLQKLDVQTDQQTEKLRSKIKTKQTETQMYQQQSQVIQQALEMEDQAQLFEMYLSPESEAVAGIKESQGENRTVVIDINFINNLVKFREHIEKMDIELSDGIIDLTATPVLHEVLDTKLDGSCSVRDVVVLNIPETNVTLFTDFDKHRLRSIYQARGQPGSSVLRVSERPWCITVIREGEVAVSFFDTKYIIIVSVTPDLELLSTIQTSKKYRGLSALDQSTLVVASSSPPSVDFIDMKGTILKSFTPMTGVGKISSDLRYTHVTRQGTILIADESSKSVLCLTQSGNIVFTYTPTGNRSFGNPCGITSTRTGDILVADWSKHKVIHLSQSGVFKGDILTAEVGLKFPFGLCVDEDKLIVSMNEKGIHQYRFV